MMTAPSWAAETSSRGSACGLAVVSARSAAPLKIGIAREITGNRQRRIFAYAGYLRVVERGTEPISR
jgi:hypothetical protein